LRIIQVLNNSLIIGALALALLTSAAPALAGGNDVTLHRFGECQFGDGVCRSVETNDEAFYDFARDIGLVFAPALGTTAETLGQAGFAVQVDQTFAVIDANEEYWLLADADGTPTGTLPLTQFRIRKGLPLSLEIGGMFTVLWESELVAVGTEFRWALHEDYLWPVPDIALRGYVNTILGHSQLAVTVAGGEVVTGLPIGVGNVMNITPYAGYNLSAVVMASRLIDATPMDPRPPVDATQPEFVFPVDTTVVHQGVAGLRLQFAVANVGFQAQFSSTVQNYTLSYGLEF
jgi:hypothetical protein